MTKECDEDCQNIKEFIKEYSNPLYVMITSFEDYFKSVDKDARTCYRKALKAGCEVRKVDKITPELYQQILDIFTSKPVRQERDMNFLYHLYSGGSHDLRESWPHPDYSVFTCPKHYMDFYGCFIGDTLVAFIELLHSNNLASTYSTMGHADYLSKGVMKFMFLEVVRLGNIKCLHYGDKDRNTHMKYFLEDLKITQCNPSFIYNLSNE